MPAAIHPAPETTRPRVFVTAADVEDFTYNFGVEPQSHQLETAEAG